MVAAIVAGVLTLAAGVALAVAPAGDGSLIVFGDGLDLGVVSESLLQACRVVTAQGPLVFGLVPLLGAAVGMRLSAGALAPQERLVWGAAAGVPFGLVMVATAVVARSQVDFEALEPDLVTTGLTSFGWAAAGGLLGAWGSLEPDQRPKLLRPIGAAVRSFAVAFTLSLTAVTAVVVVQTVRDAGGAQAGRPEVRAAIENGLFAAEHGTHGLALGTLAQFDAPRADRVDVPGESAGLLLPVPITKLAQFEATDGYRITAYQDVLPGWLFAAGAAGLIGLALCLCLYGGFAAARAAGGATAAHRIASGLVVGPVWAVLMTVANVLSNKTAATPLFGIGDLGSVAAMALIFGTLAGALGGAVSSR